MNLTRLNGAEIDLPQPVSSAFAALARGEASDGQQRLVLKTIFRLAGMDDIAEDDASERLVGKMDGARWLGRTVGMLTGHGVPHTFGEKPTDE